MKRVCVIGEGAWGTAVSTLLAHNGYSVNLWCHFESVAQQIQQTRENKQYLPGIQLDENIQPMTNMADALTGVTWVFEAIPVQYLRSVLQEAKSLYKPEQKWVVLSKGIEADTLLFPAQMLGDVFKKPVSKVILAGPSFAECLAKKDMTGVAIAASDVTCAQELQTVLHNDYFTSSYTNDVTGVEVGSALKNVLALGVGLVSGAGFADNAKALVFTKGYEEIIKLAVAMGAKVETLCGFAGVGDLVLTCMGGHSRNVKTGRMLGEGKSLQHILDETGMTPEGINTVKSMYELARRHKVDMPTCMGIYEVIFEGKSVKLFLDELVAG